MNLLLLNAASGSKLEQALEKLVDFGMDAGKDIFVAILIYSVGRFIIKQISVLIAKVRHSCISPWQYNHVIQRLWTL